MFYNWFVKKYIYINEREREKRIFANRNILSSPFLALILNWLLFLTRRHFPASFYAAVFFASGTNLIEMTVILLVLSPEGLSPTHDPLWCKTWPSWPCRANESAPVWVSTERQVDGSFFSLSVFNVQNRVRVHDELGFLINVNVS